MTEINPLNTNSANVGATNGSSSKNNGTISDKSAINNASANSTSEDESVTTDFDSANSSKLQAIQEIREIEQRIHELKLERAELINKTFGASSKEMDSYNEQIKEIDASISDYYNQIDSIMIRINQITASAASMLGQTTSTSAAASGNTVTTSASASASISDGNFDNMLQHVFAYEGGYSNDPDDRGGATQYGITQATYTAYKGKYVDVRNITRDEARDIYYKNYYVASGASEIAKTNPQLAFAVFDAAVNHGVGRAKSFLSQCNGNVDKFMTLRKNFYKQIVANNPSQAKFAKGWQNRWNKVYSVINSNHKYENYI